MSDTSAQNQEDNYGLFITLEGGEGVGKSSNIAFIESYLKPRLKKSGKNLFLTREPGGTPLAEEIRKLIIEPRKERVFESTELLLMFAARSQHLSSFILPKLKQGDWVLSDRFTDASYAYQGGGRQMDTGFIETLERLVQKGVQPDLTFLLDLPVEVGMARAKQRSDFDRIEQEQLEFFERVRESYLERARQYPDRFCIIDANQTLGHVQKDIALKLDELFAGEAL